LPSAAGTGAASGSADGFFGSECGHLKRMGNLPQLDLIRHHGELYGKVADVFRCHSISVLHTYPAPINMVA
jgi:hypothetical protein